MIISTEYVQKKIRTKYMSEENSLKEKIKNEIEKIAAMDGKQKLSYFKTYYLIPTIIVVFLLACLVSFLFDAVFARKQILYSGGICSCTVSEEGKRILTEDFWDELNGTKRQEVVLSDDLILSYTEADAYNNQSTDAALFTFLATGEFHYLLMDTQIVRHIVEMNAFVDISEQAKKYDISTEDCIRNEDGEPVAMKLPKELCEKLGVSGNTGDVYLAFVYIKGSSAINDKFTEYLFERLK